MFSKYDVYTDCGSIYCYKDTNVLRNKVNIRDYETLKHADADITAVKQQAMLLRSIAGRFTSHHLCQIYRFLFENIYPLNYWMP